MLNFLDYLTGKVGTRKMTLASAFAVLGMLAEVTLSGGISTNFSGLLIGLFGAFAAGNVGEHMAKAKAGASNPLTVTTADVEQIQTSAASIATALTELKGGVGMLAQAQNVNSQGIRAILTHINEPPVQNEPPVG